MDAVSCVTMPGTCGIGTADWAITLSAQQEREHYAREPSFRKPATAAAGLRGIRRLPLNRISVHSPAILSRRADRTTFTVSRISSGTVPTASSRKQSASEMNEVFNRLESVAL